MLVSWSMKKLLWILVLGLLWSGNVHSAKYPSLNNSIIKFIHQDDGRSYVIELLEGGICYYKVNNGKRRGGKAKKCSWIQNINKFEIQFNNRFIVHAGELTDSGNFISGSYNNTKGERGIFRGSIKSNKWVGLNPKQKEPKSKQQKRHDVVDQFVCDALNQHKADHINWLDQVLFHLSIAHTIRYTRGQTRHA